MVFGRRVGAVAMSRATSSPLSVVTLAHNGDDIVWC